MRMAQRHEMRWAIRTGTPGRIRTDRHDHLKIAAQPLAYGRVHDPLLYPSSSATPGVRDRMTVGAQQPQVLVPVVTPVSVHVIDFQGHRSSEPLGPDTAFSAFLGHAHLAKRPPEQMGPGATPTAVPDQNLCGGLDRSGPAPLVRLPEEVSGAQARLRRPLPEQRTHLSAVRPAQEAQGAGDGEGALDRIPQILHRRAGRGPPRRRRGKCEMSVPWSAKRFRR